MTPIESERDYLAALADVAEDMAVSARAVMDDLSRASLKNGVVVLPDGATQRRYELHDLVRLVEPIAGLAGAI